MAESYSVKAVLSATDKGFTSTMKSASGSLDSLKSTIANGIGFGALMSIGQRAMSAISSGVSELIGEIDDSNKAWKTFTSNMEIAGKSSKDIKKVKKELQDFATQTIYGASDMASTYSQLEAVGTKNTTKLVKGFGGLAAAAENPAQAMKTLSQQATQMAARPKVAWQDFKLMLEQTPAGIAAVAKQMGKTAAELVSDVQNGKVATEDFFDAITEVGNNPAFSKLARSYKSVGEATDGLKETISNKLQPAYEELSDEAIKGIEKIIDKVDELNFDTLLSIDNLKSVAGSVGAVMAGAMSISGGNTIIDMASMIPSALGSVASKVKTFGSDMKKSLDLNYQKRNLNEIAKKSGKTVNEIRSDVGKMAGEYRKSGMSASDAMEKAYKDIGLDSGTMTQKIKAKFSSMMDGPKKFASNTKTIFSNLGNITEMILPNSITSRTKKLSSGIGGVLGKLKGKATTFGGTMKSTLAGAFVIDTEAPLARLIDFGKKASGNFKAIGSAIKSNMGMGGKAIGKLGSTMTKVFGVALKAVGPAAIVGLVIAALGVLDSQFGGTLSNLINAATEKGPEVIQGFIDGILTKLPTLTSTGGILLGGLLNAITANLPTILSGGAQIVVSLVQGVIDNLPQLIPAATELISTLIMSIGELMPQLIVVGLQLIMALITGISQNLPQIIIAALNALMAFAQGIIDNLPQLLEQGAEMIDAVVDGISKGMPGIVSAGIALIVAIVNSLSKNMPKILSSGKKLVMALLKGILALLGQLISAGGKLVSSIANGIGQKISAVRTAAGKIVDAAGKKIKDGIAKAKKWGSDFVNGIASGIRGAIGKVTSAASSVASSIKSLLHFSRPDRGPLRPYEKWMPDFMKGLADGIRDNISLIDSAIGEVVDSMLLDDFELCPTLSVDRSFSGSGISGYSDSMALDENYSYYNSGKYTITVVSELDGRELARGSAVYMQDELNKNQRRENRKKGKI